MFDWIYKSFGRFFYLIFTFFLLYMFSFWLGMKVVEPFFSGSLQHPFRNLFYGCLVGSFLSFAITAVVHLVYKNFSRILILAVGSERLI
ncbi:hypothetical protein ACFSTH_15880 [Paenibacillus yanchengensis]|uniref:Uncharacterized protein n=1 Tax=Paenibacillus yanchengensis TaxID=2035833 RepID=A0ABW4YHE5_9BACL